MRLGRVEVVVEGGGAQDRPAEATCSEVALDLELRLEVLDGVGGGLRADEGRVDDVAHVASGDAGIDDGLSVRDLLREDAPGGPKEVRCEPHERRLARCEGALDRVRVGEVKGDRGDALRLRIGRLA